MTDEVRVGSWEFTDPHKAILRVISGLIQRPTASAIIRVSDEDKANEVKDIIMEAVDRIRIEFDGSEDGPNLLWTPSKLQRDDGKVVLEGPYDQVIHPKGFEAER